LELSGTQAADELVGSVSCINEAQSKMEEKINLRIKQYKPGRK
jgi:hypothetical protein